MPERIEELLMMGLRLRDGVERARFRQQTGQSLDSCLDPERLATLTGEGLVTFDDTRLAATAEGRQRLNGVLSYLLG